MSAVLSWIRRADPMGATIKGVIVLIFGVVCLVAGRVWIGVPFMVLGLAMFALPAVSYTHLTLPTNREV